MKTAPNSNKMFLSTLGETVLRPAKIATAAVYDKHRSFSGMIVSGIVLVGLSIAFVDRPAATWSHAARHGISVFPVPSVLLDPMLPLATVGLVAAGVIIALSKRSRPWTKTLIACCLATVIALVLKEQLKFVFGRTFPESGADGGPSWIGNGAYGFHPFHGGAAWASFPSGHTAAVTAAAGVLWVRLRSLRWVWGSAVVLVAIALFATDYHFVGDIIAGAYLGAGCAATILTLVV